MKYEVLRNDRVIRRATDYDPTQAKQLLDRYGLGCSSIPLTMTKRFSVASIHFMPVEEVKPRVDRLHRLSTHPERVVTEEAVVYTYSVVEKTPQTLKREAIQRLDELHAQYEQSFTPFEECLIKFDLQARINVAGLVKGFQSGVLTQTQWRAKKLLQEDRAFEPNVFDPSILESVKLPITSVQEAEQLQAAIVRATDLGFSIKSTLEEHIETLNDDAIKTYRVERAFQEALNNATN